MPHSWPYCRASSGSPLGQESLAPGLQGGGELDGLQEGIQGQHLLAHGVPGGFPQGLQRGDHLQAEGVESGQGLLVLGGEGLVVSPGVEGPPGGGGPPAAEEVPSEDVVLQPVALLQGEPCQAGLQVTEHVLIGIAPRHRVQGGGDQGEDGFPAKCPSGRTGRGGCHTGQRSPPAAPNRGPWTGRPRRCPGSGTGRSGQGRGSPPRPRPPPPGGEERRRTVTLPSQAPS